MYFFVRFTGIVTVVMGVLLMFFGFGAAIYGFVQNEALVDLVNNYWLVGSNMRLVDARFYASAFGLMLFLVGMIASALGQLMLVFADVARNTRETTVLLRTALASRRPREDAASGARETGMSVSRASWDDTPTELPPDYTALDARDELPARV